MPDNFLPDNFLPDNFLPDSFLPDSFTPDDLSKNTGEICTIKPREPSTLEQLGWALSAWGSGFRLEIGRWKDKDTGKWIMDKLHFHLGRIRGLDSHHLPYEIKRWWKNLKDIIKNPFGKKR